MHNSFTPSIPHHYCLFILILLYLNWPDQLAAEAWEAGNPLQLANIYQSQIKLDEYWVSEKLDGVRAYWDGKQLRSKQGHVYHAPAWFIEALPDFPLDGELWLDRGRFADLLSTVRKQQAINDEWQKVTYQVFDLPHSRLTFDQRLAYLRDFFSQHNRCPWLKLIPQFKVKTEQALLEKLSTIEQQKGEGLMLHRGSALYRSGRTDALLKLKSYADAEAIVIAYSPGKGKYQGKLGALIVEAINGAQKGKQFKLGSGFSDQERAHPPEIGSLVTYKYFGFTSTGLPRFASYLRVRLD